MISGGRRNESNFEKWELISTANGPVVDRHMSSAA